MDPLQPSSLWMRLVAVSKVASTVHRSNNVPRAQPACIVHAMPELFAHEVAILSCGPILLFAPRGGEGAAEAVQWR